MHRTTPTRALSSAIGVLALTLLSVAPAPAQQSQNITLLSTQNPHAEYTGCWPYIHSDGREYVAVGARLGTSIVRLTDPANPVEVAFIPGPSDGVREMEQYQAYLYVVARGPNAAGIQVISMVDPDHPVLANTVNTITTAENVTIDTVRGYLYTTETAPAVMNTGIHIFSLADPVNPVQIGTYEPYTVHDITVKGTRGYACSMGDGKVHILDLTNPATPVEMASFTTALATPHTAWPSTDDHYLFVTDENLGNGRVSDYNIQNLAQITFVHSFDDLLQSSTHFPMVRGNLLFVAHYTVGARVYDVTNPAQPVEVAYYDTWQGDDGIFAGTYEEPPFYPSGIFTATDRLSGLYVFRINPAYGIVRGTVRSGNKVVAGAKVRVLPSGPSFVTGADGIYGLAPSASVSVTLECSKFGSATQTATIGVAQGSEQTVNFSLPPAGTGTVKGVARRASNQTVLPGVDVVLENTPVAAITSGMGKYTMQKVPEGSYSVRAELLDLAPASTPITVTPHSSANVDFALQAPPFYDDAETDRGWTLGAPDDDAVAGRWIRDVPIGTTNGSFEAQPSQDHSPAPGTICFVTGNAPAGSPNTQESVRGGKTTLISPSMDLSGITDPRIAYWLWSYNTHDIVAPFGSTFTTEISNDGGASWSLVSTFMASRAPWVRIELRALDYFAVPSNSVKVRFTVENRIAGVVEAALDDFKFYSGALTGALSAGLAGGPAALAASGSFELRRVGANIAQLGGAWELRLSEPAAVRAELFDVQGRLVRRLEDGMLPKGTYQIHWDGRLGSGKPAASGVYWLRIQADKEVLAQKVVLAH